MRLYDLKGPAGLWGAWFDYATSKGGATATGTAIPTTDGYAFGLRHQRLEWHGGYHSFSIQYGTGAASNFSTSIDDPTPFLHSSARLLAVEQVLFQPNDRFAIMPIFIYQRSKDGNPQHDWIQWVSFGARPEIFFTKYISVAFEAGFDHTHSVWPVRRMAAQVHDRATNRSGQKVFQPAGPSRVPDVCELVERIPGLCRRSALSRQNERVDIRRAS